VRASSGIRSLDQLAGKTVNLGRASSGTPLSARDVFSRLNIKIEEVTWSNRKLWRSQDWPDRGLGADLGQAGGTNDQSDGRAGVAPAAVPFAKSLQTTICRAFSPARTIRAWCERAKMSRPSRLRQY